MEFTQEDLDNLAEEDIIDFEIDEDEDDYEEGMEFETETKAKTGWYYFKTPDGLGYYTPFPRGSTEWSIASDESEAILNELKEKDPELYKVGLHTFYRRYNEEGAATKNETTLPAGVYNYAVGDQKPARLEKTDLRTDLGINIHESYDLVNTDIKQFLENKEIYDDLGALYKLGLLLYGPPGNGKSTLIRKILTEAIGKDAVIIFVGGDFPRNQFLQHVRDTLQDRLKVFVFEELATNLRDSYIEALLGFLDGEQSIGNSIILATTNYPQSLPGNIVNRPARFDKLYKFDNPNEAQRKLLLNFFFKNRGVEIGEKEISATKGLSIAALRELTFLSLINKMSFVEAAKRLKDRSEVVKKGFAESGSTSVGFGGYRD